MIKNRAYGPIIFKMCPTATFAREYFKKVLIIPIKIIKTEQIFIKINNKKNQVNCEHYWDIAQTDAILEQSDS